MALRGDHVVVNKVRGKPKSRTYKWHRGFWNYDKHWLYTYRGVPHKLFHLYLGEVSYHFNHREEPIFPLIHKTLTTIPKIEVNQILVRDP
ncbi:MAG: hypothetical protein LIQ31_06095 [Planctomycetes bacterium]|nr:hypothetical protein [Planctomycetota bacterium]